MSNRQTRFDGGKYTLKNYARSPRYPTASGTSDAASASGRQVPTYTAGRYSDLYPTASRYETRMINDATWYGTEEEVSLRPAYDEEKNKMQADKVMSQTDMLAKGWAHLVRYPTDHDCAWENGEDLPTGNATEGHVAIWAVELAEMEQTGFSLIKD
ncbi:hypothetical protein IAT38_007986 [Cryptococcus sp. DSM 104549]